MPEKKEIIHVYFMPGLGTNHLIFENIKLPEDQFKVHWLEWLIPEVGETIEHYAERISKNVEHDNCVLIGVSFGGVIVQEMKRFLNPRRLIIISSVKCRQELPRRIRLASKTGFYQLIPTSLLDYVDSFEKVAVGDFLKTRAKLYRKYMLVRNKTYLDWSIKNMVNWDCEKPAEDIVHIHGDQDEIFPYKYIKNCITVKGGTHLMIINRYKWFNEHLPEIILTGKTAEKQNKKER